MGKLLALLAILVGIAFVLLASPNGSVAIMFAAVLTMPIIFSAALLRARECISHSYFYCSAARQIIFRTVCLLLQSNQFLCRADDRTKRLSD